MIATGLSPAELRELTLAEIAAISDLRAGK
jgi:hypothetical protein